MAKNVHMYHEEETDKNINIRQKVKSVISKAILKWPNLETIKEDQGEADVNLRRNSNSY